MKIKSELENLNTQDVYSLVMFVMYKLHNKDEYSSLSELSFVLDKEYMLKLCAVCGGRTVYIPKLEELENILNALLLYQKVNIENQSFKLSLLDLDISTDSKEQVKSIYEDVCSILKDYTFNTRSNE